MKTATINKKETSRINAADIINALLILGTAGFIFYHVINAILYFNS
ncbi:MAG: hypothetical protein J0M08_07935 [Bacteroidetes bacterium]|nr:hypothetical protein [Bacteroidota bacterium]